MAAKVQYFCDEWESNELIAKFPWALRNPFKVGTPVFALVVSQDVQSWEYAIIKQLHTAHPSDPSKKWLHYEVVIESSKSVVVCDYEEIAPVRVRLTLQEYEFIMGTDSEETVDIKKMNNTEMKAARDCVWIGAIPLYWHEHSKHLTLMRVTDGEKYRHPFITVAYNPTDKDRVFRVHVASTSLEEYCRVQDRLQLREHSAFGISLQYYFHTDHEKHLWQEGKIISFSPFFRRYVVQIDGAKYLFDHADDQIAFAQYDDEDRQISGEKVIINWINREKQTAEIVLFTFSDHEEDMVAKTLVVPLSNVKYFPWAKTVIPSQTARLSQDGCLIA